MHLFEVAYTMCTHIWRHFLSKSKYVDQYVDFGNCDTSRQKPSVFDIATKPMIGIWFKIKNPKTSSWNFFKPMVIVNDSTLRRTESVFSNLSVLKKFKKVIVKHLWSSLYPAWHKYIFSHRWIFRLLDKLKIDFGLDKLKTHLIEWSFILHSTINREITHLLFYQ